MSLQTGDFCKVWAEQGPWRTKSRKWGSQGACVFHLFTAFTARRAGGKGHKSTDGVLTRMWDL